MWLFYLIIFLCCITLIIQEKSENVWRTKLCHWSRSISNCELITVILPKLLNNAFEVWTLNVILPIAFLQKKTFFVQSYWCAKMANTLIEKDKEWERTIDYYTAIGVCIILYLPIWIMTERNHGKSFIWLLVYKKEDMCTNYIHLFKQNVLNLQNYWQNRWIRTPAPSLSAPLLL